MMILLDRLCVVLSVEQIIDKRVLQCYLLSVIYIYFDNSLNKL